MLLYGTYYLKINKRYEALNRKIPVEFNLTPNTLIVTLNISSGSSL